LLVEDNAGERFGITELLRDDDVDIVAAETGEDARPAT
jgi:hypothetical protein